MRDSSSSRTSASVGRSVEQRRDVDERSVGDRGGPRHARHLAGVLHPAQLLHHRARGLEVEIGGEGQPGGVGEVLGLGEHRFGTGGRGDEERGDVGPGAPGDDLGVDAGVGDVGRGARSAYRPSVTSVVRSGATTTQPSEPPKPVSQRMFDGFDTTIVRPSRRSRRRSERRR